MNKTTDESTKSQDTKCAGFEFDGDCCIHEVAYHTSRFSAITMNNFDVIGNLIVEFEG